MTPKEVLQKWVETFNQGLAEQLGELYHEDAINHQVVTDPVVGKAAITQMFKNEFAQADMTCLVDNIFEDGEWAIMEWQDPLGLRGCGFFHIVDDRIKFQRGYFDQLSFFRQQGIPLPTE